MSHTNRHMRYLCFPSCLLKSLILAMKKAKFDTIWFDRKALILSASSDQTSYKQRLKVEVPGISSVLHDDESLTAKY